MASFLVTNKFRNRVITQTNILQKIIALDTFAQPNFILIRKILTLMNPFQDARRS